MNIFPLFIFIFGVLIGAMIVFYIVQERIPCQPDSKVSGASLEDLLRTQAAFQQSQNMLRQLQLEQARQEAEYRQLEQERVKYLGLSQKPDYAEVAAAVSRELARRGVSC